MTRDLEDVLASIDGALAVPEWPDAMRWSPDPEHTRHPVPWHTEEPAPYFPAMAPLAPVEVHSLRRPGELLLVVAPDAETARRLFEQMTDAARAMGESMARLGEHVRRTMAELRPILERAGVLPDEGPDRLEQPFERALWVKAQRGTGPDRQVQHRPRPRRHLL